MRISVSLSLSKAKLPVVLIAREGRPEGDTDRERAALRGRSITRVMPDARDQLGERVTKGGATKCRCS